LSTLTVVVLTFNEEQNIAECLASVKSFADEFLVFDSNSQDATCAIARTAGARVLQRHFDNYPSQRNAALDAVSSDWIFFLDADERATDSGRKEMRTKIDSAQSSLSGPVLYWVPRKNYIFGRWIKHAGWSPDYQPRLLRNGKCRFDPTRPVHELVIADGGEAFLKEPLDHSNYKSLAQFRAKQSAYSRFEAQMLYDQKVESRWRSLIGQPMREFARRFISLEGYKDGAYGLLLSGLMAYYAWVRMRTLREMYGRGARRQL
jgi:(heptosyl)LPS beta-1,4-glucosyltransferase